MQGQHRPSTVRTGQLGLILEVGVAAAEAVEGPEKTLLRRGSE